MSEIKRRFYRITRWPTEQDIKNGDYSGAVAEPTEIEIKSNLIGSRTYTLDEKGESLHAPALDIDFEARLLPSSTPGHYHLYLDKEMPWNDYLELLTVMAKVGIIEKKYLEHAIRNGQTQVRKPGHVKKFEMELPYAIRVRELRDAMTQVLIDAGVEKEPEREDLITF